MGILNDIIGLFEKFGFKKKPKKIDNFVEDVLIEGVVDSSNKEIVKIINYKESHENLSPEYERILNVLLMIHTLVDKSKNQRLSILDAANLVAYQKELYIFSKRNSNTGKVFSSFDDDESTIELTADDLKKYVEFLSFNDDEETYNITDSDLSVFASFEDDVETVINIAESDLEFFTGLNENGSFIEKCKNGGKKVIDGLVSDFSQFKKDQLSSKHKQLSKNNSDIIGDVDDNGYRIPTIDLTSCISNAVSNAVRDVGIKQDAFDLDEFTLGLDKDK